LEDNYLSKKSIGYRVQFTYLKSYLKLMNRKRLF